MITFTKRQDQIVDASLKIINQVGVQYYTIKRLAAEIEVTEGAIYKHFESKDAIVEAIIRWAQDDVDRIVAETRQLEGGPVESLRRLFLSRCGRPPEERTLAAWLGVYNAIRNHIELKRQANRVINTYFEEVMRLIKDGQANGEIRAEVYADVVLQMYTGSLHFLLNEWQRSGYKLEVQKQGKALWGQLEAFLTPR